jgi:hypothetical protein
MSIEDDAKKVMVQRKHELHEETLTSCIADLQDVLSKHTDCNSLEDIFAHVKATSATVLFLLQERKRDRDKRGSDFTKPVNPIPTSGNPDR